MATRKLVNQVP